MNHNINSLIELRDKYTKALELKESGLLYY